MTDIAAAMDLVDAGELDEAFAICNSVLHLDPNDYVALCVLCAALAKSGDKTTIAYHLGKRLTELDPKKVAGWINYGKAACDLWQMVESQRAYRNGLALARKQKGQTARDCEHNILVNLSALYIDIGEFERAEQYAREAIEIKAESHKAWANIGFSQLARRNWAEGWANYHRCLGNTDWRPASRIADEEEWQGEKVDTLVVYGEQGIGDEICFGSMIRDTAKLSGGKVIVECDKRLEGLFKRSFPELTVYGTRGKKSMYWEPEDRNVDASLATGQLGEYVRLKDEDFDVIPYLVADPVRSGMWKHEFAKYDKPTIGIAWTGGIPRTGARFRRCTLEDYLPLFESIDAHWVSLEYKRTDDVAEFKAEHPEVDLVEYDFATYTKDYDDTAALVSQLDCVVSVPTAVWHLAGALGTPVIALKARYECWKTKAGIPFHPVMSFVEYRTSWKETITRSLPKVEQCIAFLSDTTPDSPLDMPSPPIRSNGTPANLLQSSP